MRHVPSRRSFIQGIGTITAASFFPNLLLSQDANKKLGIAVIGSVITSAFHTLLVIPTLYEILDGWRSWFAQRLGIRTAARTAEHRIPQPVPASGD